MEELELQVQEWARNKGLLFHGNEAAQLKKMKEEVLELEEAIDHYDRYAVQNELGDVLVTCAVQAALWGLSLEECLQAAYTKISVRAAQLKHVLLESYWPLVAEDVRCVKCVHLISFS